MAPKPLRWDSEKTFKLIENFEMFPELWNSGLKEYREKDKKATALNKIADTLGMDVAEINRKWHNLRCQMNSEIRKWKRKRCAGGGNDAAWKSNWEFFDALHFMSRYSECFKNTGNLPVNMEQSTSGKKCSKNAVISRKRKVKDDLDLKQLEDGQEQESKSLIKEEMSLINNLPDDNNVFGEFVASELRQLRSEERRRKLKRIIQKAIIAIGEDEEEDDDDEGEEEETSPCNSSAKSYEPRANSTTSFCVF